MNENRTVFAFGGITGAIGAILGLVATAIILNVIGLFVQQDNARNYYKIQNEKSLTAVNTGKTSDDFIVSVPAPE